MKCYSSYDRHISTHMKNKLARLWIVLTGCCRSFDNFCDVNTELCLFQSWTLFFVYTEFSFAGLKLLCCWFLQLVLSQLCVEWLPITELRGFMVFGEDFKLYVLLINLADMLSCFNCPIFCMCALKIKFCFKDV